MEAVTEEDLSFIKGGGLLGERDCMRTLLDVLQQRGEEPCQAFLFLLSKFEAANFTRTTNLSVKDPVTDHLQRHKDILARQHTPGNYLGSTSGLPKADWFTDITFSKIAGRQVPVQFQHETSVVGDAFRAGRAEARRHGETCSFKDIYRSLLSDSGNGVALLSGVAGSGKTTVIKRLVQEWAVDADTQKIILPLSFRELSLITEPLSLQVLLSDHYNHLKPILPELMTSNQGQLLLILDGLDEFCFPLDFERTPKCSDPERELSVGAMVVNLIKRILLPDIAILLTSRPHAVTKVPQLLVNNFYSVLGFSPDQQRQYFEKSCSSSMIAPIVWAFVSSHKPLQLMCHIPAFCWIVSTALHNGASCLFSDFVPQSGGCVEGMHLNRLQDAPRVLKETKAKLRCLGALAFKGLLERRFVSGLLVPKTRFILNGLFRDEPRSYLASCVPLPHASPPFVLQLLHSQLHSPTLSPERQLNVCHCLYEAQDPGLPQRLQAWLKLLSQEGMGHCNLANRDWSELAFLLQLSPDLQTLSLEAQGLNAEGLRRLLPVLPLFSTLRLAQNPLGPEGAEVLSLALQSPDCHIEKLWVVSTGLGCEGVRILAEGLKKNHTVYDLRMAINNIGDIGAASLAELLKTNHTLKDIRLRDNLVTDKGAELLKEALMKNTTLEFLWLFDNKLSKEGVRQLKEFSKNRPSIDIKVCF
ncbi:hypothetical protein QTP86_028386 [Hemibagrus guttatus]|nr:hypothetical protein QTP86_028386 [Hemibagrus guttatus]